MTFKERLKAAYRAFKGSPPVDYRKLLKAYMIQAEINHPAMMAGGPPLVEVYISQQQGEALKSVHEEVEKIRGEAMQHFAKMSGETAVLH